MRGWSRDLDLHLTAAPSLDEAREGIEVERRLGVRPVPLRVVHAAPVPGEEHLYELEVECDGPLEEGSAWAGARVERSLEDGEAGVWRTEVVEVDASSSRIFVEDVGPAPPAAGTATLWPYDFLAAPHKILTSSRCQPLWEPLRHQLAAAAGSATGSARPVSTADAAWGWSWTLVWGPPGTGKTWTLGRQVVRLLADDPTERVLVVSTTHRATDAAALELGKAAVEGGEVPLVRLQRVGGLFRAQPFRDAGLERLLPGPYALLEAMDGARRRAASKDPGRRAAAQRKMLALRRGLPTLGTRALDPRFRALVTTVHAGLSLTTSEDVLRLLEEGRAPFTTVVVDEAGLVGRVIAATLALLATRRVVLVGDPRQLSPISRAARSLPRPVVEWLARSGLEHLHTGSPLPHVQRLRTQRRMHPAISGAISDLQYGGTLVDHPAVQEREWARSGTLRRLPRVLWIPADSFPDMPRAEAASQRGPGGRSRVRAGTRRILAALADAQPELRRQRGLFISPFRAQARAAARWLRELGLEHWRASTVHAQQGAEADVVVFDTVHASSTAWPAEEWCRLVNVGLSRARHLLILVASRDEVDQPWMRPLRAHLVARSLRPAGEGHAWVEPDSPAEDAQADLFKRLVPRAPAPRHLPEEHPDPDPRLGGQLARRRALRPVLSSEQRALVHRELSDAGPRLVRGVAGSGKTLVLAHWVARTLMGQGFETVAVFYANRALRPLIAKMIDAAWQAYHPEETPVPAFPWHRVRLLHMGDWLEGLLRERGLERAGGRYDYEEHARQLLEGDPLEPRLDAAFVDEAQDVGHAPLRVVVASVRPYQGRRPVLVFYDNAQNVYGRKPPIWKELGLDMRGRSDVMRESFRSTRPATELALNLVSALRPLGDSPDFRELQRAGLLVEGERDGTPWWEARFCTVDGERPTVRVYDTWEEEVAGAVQAVRRWVVDEDVRPGDVRVITLRKELREDLAAALGAALPCPVRHATWQGFEEARDAVVVTTPQSFKGYDAEAVLVAGVDRFDPRGEPAIPPLYVALTRARTVLHVSGSRVGHPALVRALESLAAASS